MRRVPRKIVGRQYRLSRPLLAAFAAVIVSSALLGLVPALNQGTIGSTFYGTGERPHGRQVEARRAAFLADNKTSSAGPQGTAQETAQEAAIVRASLAGSGFTAAGNPVRHEQDTEIPVRDSQGHAWIAWLDGSGKTSEVEIVDYDEDKVPDAPAFKPEDLPSMIAKDGFQARGQAERRPEHFNILAVNQHSELVELHIDFAGQIYKQVWVR